MKRVLFLFLFFHVSFKHSPVKYFLIYSTYFMTLSFLTPRSDQREISHFSINTMASRQVMRITKIINEGLLPWCKTKFYELTLKEIVIKENLHSYLGSQRFNVKI